MTYMSGHFLWADMKAQSHLVKWLWFLLEIMSMKTLWIYRKLLSSSVGQTIGMKIWESLKVHIVNQFSTFY